MWTDVIEFLTHNRTNLVDRGVESKLITNDLWYTVSGLIRDDV